MPYKPALIVIRPLVAVAAILSVIVPTSATRADAGGAVKETDADRLRLITKAAAEATFDDGRMDEESRLKIARITATIRDTQVRREMEAFIPSLRTAAARHAQDAPLLAEVKRLNGKATFEIDAPDWLRTKAGDDALAVFARVTELNLNERTDGHKEPDNKPLSQRVNDDTLKLLVGQDHLRRLELSGTAVTSAGMVHLKDITSLQFLSVCLTAVDDEGIAYLSALTHMKRLTVCSCKVTGSGFAHLQGMKELESINLHSSPASDVGLEAIGKLTSLRRLEIVHTNVTDEGLAHLATLTNLRQFHVHGKTATDNALPFIDKLTELYELDIYDHAASNATLAKVARLPKLRQLRLYIGVFDDDGVKQLAGLTSLEELVLNSSKVTDASIAHLAGLKNLRTVVLSGTRVTEAGRSRLKELLPNVEIKP